MKQFLLILFLLCCIFLSIDTNVNDAPVAHQGRFRPLEAVSKDIRTLQVVPSRQGNGVWITLAELGTKNNTLWSDNIFERVRTETDQKQLLRLLKEGYQPLAGKVYLRAKGKALHYPSTTQLWLEAFYVKYPLVIIIICIYMLAGIALFLNWGLAFALIAFALHTLLLTMRCYILERPPVSNMFETVLYVPWVAMLIGLLMRRKIPLLASILGAISLLILLNVSGLDQSMENVQAVLDSQYWLIVHVLMVVGSYGIFILSGILGHIYLLKRSSELAQMILQTMYLGIVLLIPGTILGGIWAAQSWGRFWDWDPKESWAFISSCVYLICVHAYRFGHIGNFGLAIGSIAGLMAISFTWYGVNYILGTGLHSYGFGSGGEYGYFLYLLIELSIIIGFIVANKKATVLHSANVKKISPLEGNETR